MQSDEKKIIIFAAGTGGHIYPAISIAKELIEKNISVLWIGTKQGIENRIVTDLNIKIEHINFSGIRGKSLITMVKMPFQLLKATIQSLIIIKKYNPSISLSMGGYISFPCCIASFILRKPIIIHEQNIIFGLANNILKYLSRKVILGMPIKNNNKKFKYFGNPTRYENIIIKKKSPKQKKINILVIGGSLGAKIFNEIVPQAIYSLKKELDYEINIIHQTGKTNIIAEKQYKNINVNIDLKEYIDSMKEVYEWCDIIICRGGAITISELTLFGVPSIIVPYPYATDDHQMKNSMYLERNEAAIVINQKNFTQVYLAQTLKSLIINPEIRKSLSENILKLKKKNVIKNICDQIIKEMD